MLRIISAKMAALPALLGKATEEQQRNDFVQSQKDNTMGFASIFGGIGVLITSPEYVQHIFGGFGDAYESWMADHREKKQRL